MEYRPLGRTGVTVSALCFGCWEIGGLFWGRIDARKAAALVRKAMDLGVTTFDTSDAYGNGRSEVILGFALKGIRDKAIIVTKRAIKSAPMAPSNSTLMRKVSLTNALMRLTFVGSAS